MNGTPARCGWVLKTLFSHWRGHPMQLATLLIGLILATALWSGVQALNRQARQSYAQAAAMFGGARTATLVAKDGAPFSQSLFVALRRAGWAVSPLLEERVQINGRTVRLVGIEPLTMPKEAGAMARMDGDALRAFLMPPYQTRVARETLTSLDLQEGERPQLRNGRSLPPLAVGPALAPGVLVVDIGIAQRALEKPGQVSRLLVARRPLGPASPLAAVVGDRLHLVAPQSETGLEQLTDSFHLNLTAFGFLSFAVGLFIVNSAIGLTFEQRRPMFRTMRACGVSAQTLNGMLLVELAALALIAGAIGMLAGYGMAALLLPDVAATLRGLYSAEIPGELTLQPAWWIAGLAMTMAGAIAAAAISFIKLQRLSILAAAQPDAWKELQQRWLKRQGALAIAVAAIAIGCLLFGDSLGAGFSLLGTLLLAAALALPVMLGLLLRISERWASRYRRQPLLQWSFADSRQQLPGLSLALMALLLAIAVNVGVSTMVGSFRATFVTWLDDRLMADVYLDAASNEQAASIAQWLKQRPEHIAILPGARAETRVAGQTIELMGLADNAEYRSRWPLLAAAPDAWRRIAQGDAAFVSEQLSRRAGLKPGDTISVPTDTGDWPLTIVGIYADYGNPRGQLAVEVDALVRHFPKTPRTRLALRIASPDIPRVVADLQSTFQLGDRQIADQSEVKAESKRIFDKTFAVTAALNAFTLGVAAIALLTSLLTLANARLPQLAPLWAMGVTLPRLSAIELAKTMALALLTALLAVPLGVAVGWCLVAVVNVRAFGWRIPLQVFPSQLVALLAIAMAAALLAAAVPLAKLFRMPPARLIRIFASER